MMKKLIYTVFASALVMTGCTEEYDLDDRGLSVEVLPKYVAFDAPGTAVNRPADDVEEIDETVELNVEVPGGSVSNVTVNYTFSGTAVFGEDFNVEGATSDGGTLEITLPTSPVTNARPLNGDIVVELLTDGVEDGDKTLIVTLTSASNAEGSIVVGRAGEDVLRTATVNIADSDAPDPDA